VDPAHVKPEEPPQVPSVDTFNEVEVEDDDLPVGVLPLAEVAAVLDPQVPYPD
jgi:hypothetical protein